MTYDDMINGDHWNGTHLALRKRMADYRVDRSARRRGPTFAGWRRTMPSSTAISESRGRLRVPSFS